MYKVYIFVFIFLPWLGFSQQTILSEGKQKILLQSDGSYQIFNTDGVTVVLPIVDNELQDIQNFDIWRRGANIVEAEYFVQIYTLLREVDELFVELKQAKTSKNDIIQVDCENKIKELRIKVKDTERLYDNALYYKKLADKLEGSDVDKNVKKYNKLIEYVRSKDYLFKTIHYRYQGHSEEFSGKELVVIEEEALLLNKDSDTILTMEKDNLVKNDCKLISRKAVDETEIMHDFLPIFNYTPDRLQIFLKNENLIEGSIRLREKNKLSYMDLQIVLKSKDAAKSYGHISEGNLVRLEFINGLRLNLKTTEQILGRIEEYSGKVIYVVSFPLDKIMVKQLEKLPIDHVGLMWSSGFEKYEVYELDVLMRQFECFKTVNNL